MVRTDNAKTYIEKFQRHAEKLTEDEAVKIHVGGIKNYYRIGALERRLLEKLVGFDSRYFIDLGCGSGRLAQTLIDQATLRFLGIDVVPNLIEYCRRTLRPDWRFEVSSDFRIPEKDQAADCITAFSLFTHLLHEESFTYVKDAQRVLKPGGKLIFSFLEYDEPRHRALFLRAVASVAASRPLIVFIEKNGLKFWADELGFEIEKFISPTEKFVDFPERIHLPNGETLAGTHQFGQSVCVMRRKS
jgi:ubiquinone/menaquinone biosynthesis C-methylase UbiE